MRPRHSILLLSLVILAGCGSEEASQPGNGDFTGAHDPALESPVTVHRGLYSWGHDPPGVWLSV
jgi:hypothetical protein